MSGSDRRRLLHSWWIPLLLSLAFVGANISLSHRKPPVAPVVVTLEKTKPTTIEPQPTPEFDRAANLRDEITRLRKRIRARENTIASLHQTPAPNISPLRSIANEFLTPENWRNMGQDTPQHSLESLLHAASGGDTDTLKSILIMDKETTEFANALFDVVPEDLQTEIGDVASFIAMMTADAVSTEPARIPGVFPVNHKVATVVLTRPGEENAPHQVTSFIALRKSETAPWQIRVPVEAIERYHAKLLGPLTENESSETNSPAPANEPGV